MAVQLRFGFVQEMDDRRDGIARIDGQPVLNQPTQSGWIHRRWYRSTEEALSDAIRASALVNVPLYVCSAGTFSDGDDAWRIAQEKPFHGRVGGVLYPFRPYWIVRSGTVISIGSEAIV